MTKDTNKRKIVIEDKRQHAAPDNPADQVPSNADLLSELQASTGDALGAIDDALAEFAGKTQKTAGQAAMAEDALRRGRTPEPAKAAPEQPVARDERPPTPEELAAKHLELAQRTEAELQNFRKRAAKDKEDVRRFAVEGLLYDLFPALDGLSQAAHTFKDTPAGQNPLLDGVRSTIRVLEEALLKHGIEKINQADVPFDPHLHQPLVVENAAGVSGETVAEVYVEGFRLGDRVLKPAMVKVVKPQPPGATDPAE